MLTADDRDFRSYPFPIAGPYRALLAETEPSARVSRVFDVFESTLRFVSYCIAAERAAAGDSQQLSFWFEKPLALGSVVAWLRTTLLQRREDQVGPVEEWVRSLFFIRSVEAGPLAKLLDDLVRHRNRTRGHGITAPERQQRQLAEELQPKLQELLQLLSELARFRVLVVSRMSQFDGRAYEHQMLVAMGDNPIFRVEAQRLDQPLQSHQVLLETQNRALFALAPFATYALCDRCDDYHFFLFQAFQSGKSTYVYPLKGCRLEQALPTNLDAADAPSDGSPRRARQEARSSPSEVSMTSASAGTAPAEASVVKKRRSLLRPLPLLGFGACAAILVVGLRFLDRVRSEPPSGARVADSPRGKSAVVVTEPVNIGGNPSRAWVGKGLTDLLTLELGTGGGLTVLPSPDPGDGQRLPSPPGVVSALGSPCTPLFEREPIDYCIAWAYEPAGGEASPLLRVRLALIKRGDEVSALETQETGMVDHLPDLVYRCTEKLRSTLGRPPATGAERIELAASMPQSAQAFQSLYEGIAALESSSPTGARRSLEKAIRLDPRAPLPYVAMAEIWIALGKSEKATEACAAASERFSGLSAPRRLDLASRCAEVVGDWQAAAAQLSTLFELNPEDLHLGLRLATAQLKANLHDAAFATLGKLRALATPASEDPRIDLVQAQLAYRKSDYKSQKAFASAALDKGRQKQWVGVEASASYLLGSALQELGDQAAAMLPLEEARKLYGDLNDQRGVAKAIDALAISVYRQGDLDGFRRLCAESITVYRLVGDQLSVARTMFNEAKVLRETGQRQDADRLLDQASATFGAAGARFEVAATLTEQGANLQGGGELQRAREKYEQAMAIFSELGNRDGVGMLLTNIGEILFAQGDLSEAERLHEEALALSRTEGNLSAAAYDTRRLGLIQFARGNAAVARAKLQEALDQQVKLGETLLAAETRLGLADLELRSGSLDKAGSLSREAEEFFRAEGVRDLQAVAMALGAEVSLGQGNQTEAATTAVRARDLLNDSEDPMARFLVAIAFARIQGSAGDKASQRAAEATLDKVVAEAAASGYELIRLDANLARAEIGLRSGADGWRARLEKVAADAAARGLGQIEQRARKLLQQQKLS